MKSRTFALALALLVGLVGCSDDDDNGGTAPATRGTAVITQTPADLVGAGWSLAGPSEQDGSGNVTLTGMPVGEYTVTWDAVDDYITPVSAPQTLVAGGTITFSGTYVEEGTSTGTVVINPQPAGIDAPWEITGPAGYLAEGSGQTELTNRTSGDYTVTWGEVPGWHTPSGEIRALTAGSTVSFTGVFIEDDFVNLPPGTFTMGSPDAEPGRLSNEGPQHQVTLTQGFYVSKYEVTEEWWAEVMNETPTASQLPKRSVSWDMAVQFCNALSVREGLAPAYTIRGPNGDVTWNQDANGYRLPTEAEWEYACRATTTMAYHNNTNCLSSDTEANFRGDINQLPDCPTGIYRLAPTEVGSFPANQWGLYDMHGNVWEWVWCGQYRQYTSDAVVDPVHNVGLGASRVVRGGNWYLYVARYCRSAYRDGYSPVSGGSSYGFRPARSAF